MLGDAHVHACQELPRKVTKAMGGGSAGDHGALLWLRQGANVGHEDVGGGAADPIVLGAAAPHAGEFNRYLRGRAGDCWFHWLSPDVACHPESQARLLAVKVMSLFSTNQHSFASLARGRTAITTCSVSDMPGHPVSMAMNVAEKSSTTFLMLRLLAIWSAVCT